MECVFDRVTRIEKKKAQLTLSTLDGTRVIVTKILRVSLFSTATSS